MVMRPNAKDMGRFGLGLRSDLYYDRNCMVDPLTGKDKSKMKKEYAKGAQKRLN